MRVRTRMGVVRCVPERAGRIRLLASLRARPVTSCFLFLGCHEKLPTSAAVVGRLASDEVVSQTLVVARTQFS
jgi:hypothetical protein